MWRETVALPGLSRNTSVSEAVDVLTGPATHRGSIPDWNRRCVSALFGPDFFWGSQNVLFFRSMKWRDNEDDQSPPSSAEAKSEWNSISSPPYAIMACSGTVLPAYFLREIVEAMSHLAHLLVYT